MKLLPKRTEDFEDVQVIYFAILPNKGQHLSCDPKNQVMGKSSAKVSAYSLIM